tara:strand:+ start:100 stop:756 length:657 start_codon:yes stop_codon:yes gene_type:complete
MIEIFFKNLVFILNDYFRFCLNLGLNEVISVFILSLMIKIFIFYPEKKVQNFTKNKQKYFEKIKQEVKKNIQGLKGEHKFNATEQIYKKYKYNPIQELLLILPYLIQIPIFFTMYHLFLNINDQVFSNLKFLLVNDLSKPDNVIIINNIKINILPIIMTVINLISIRLEKNSIKIFELTVPFVFLILLYNQPSALVLYWSFNNILYLLIILYRKYFLN